MPSLVEMNPVFLLILKNLLHFWTLISSSQTAPSFDTVMFIEPTSRNREISGPGVPRLGWDSMAQALVLQYKLNKKVQ